MRFTTRERPRVRRPRYTEVNIYCVYIPHFLAFRAADVAAFFAARRLKGRVRSPSHFAPVVGAACDVELADARPVDQTFDELATVEAVRVSDAAPPELAVAKATPDGATEKML